MKLTKTLVVLGLMAHVFAAGADEAALPAGYTPLQWIQSTGTQYLKTGYIHKSNTKVECELVAYREGGDWAAVFGARKNDSNNNAYIFFVRARNTNANMGLPCYNRSGAQTSDTGLFPFEQRVKVTCDGQVATWQGLDDTTITGSITTTGTADDGTNGMYIFDLNKFNGSGGDTPDGSKAVLRLYSFRISEGENVVHDYVPCRTAAGVAGLYDLIGRTFLANAGTGTFIGSDEPQRPFLKLKRVIAPKGSYVNTEFKPNQDTRTVMEVDVEATGEYWFGAWNKAYNSGAYALCNDGSGLYIGYENQGGTLIKPALTRGHYKLELDKTTVKTNDVETYSFTATTFQVNGFLTLFLQNRLNDSTLVASGGSRIVCSSAQIYDDGTLVRDFQPVLAPWGSVGFADAKQNNAFYGSGCLTRFSYDGIAYLENGTTLVAYVGTLADDLLTGYTALEKDGVNDTLNATAVTDFTIPVTVKAGTYSVVDQTAKRYAFPSLTLKGGAALAFDLAPDGCDTFAATTFDVSDATAENPVRIIVTPYNTLGVGATPRTLIESGVTAEDLAKFRLETGVPAQLEVRDGALVLVADEPERTLPAGYTALDLVRATGLQVVKTGIDATSDTITEMSFGRIRYAHLSTFFGQGAWANNNYLFNMQSDKVYFHSSGVTAWTGVPDATDFRVWVGAGKLILSAVGGAATTNAVSNAVNTGSPELAIFALNTGSNGGAFDFYAMKIADKTGRLLRDYVPCRNPDGEPGLWDFVSRSFFYNTGTERFFTADDVDVRLTRLHVQGGAYINTGFVPDQNSCAVVDVVPNSTVEGWFGVWKTAWNSGAFALSNDGSNMYAGFGGGYNAGSNPKAPASVVDGARHTIALDKGVVKIDGDTKMTASTVQFSSTFPLFIFGQNRSGTFGVNSYDQRVTCYGAKVYDGETLVRDFLPARQADGTMGMIDAEHDNAFHSNANFRAKYAYKMTWDGLAYTLDGTVLEAREGTLATNDVATFTEVRKVGWYAVDASAVTNYPGALTLAKGVFSLKDSVARRHAVAGALTLEPGAKLALDVTPDGCDTFAAGSVALTATAESPVEVALNAVGLTELAADAKLAIFPGVTFEAADAAKFRAVGFPAQFTVEEGALYLVRKETGLATWTGAAGDGKWSTALNWLGNEVPEPGVTVKFDLPAGGETTFDIPGGRSFKAIVFGENAGTFTVGGLETLGVMAAITNLSASIQTFARPMNLGVVGLPLELVTTGDLDFTGNPVVLTDAVVKDGTGLLTMDDTDLWNLVNVTIRGGQLKTRYTGRVSGATPQDGAIRVMAGGMLDVFRDQGDAESIVRMEPFHGKTIYIAGDGDGRGALYNSYAASRWGTAFGKVVLTDDASVGGTILSVRPLPGSRIPGSAIEGPHTLTVKTVLHDPAARSRAFDCFAPVWALDRVNVTGHLTIEDPQTGTITNGVHLYDGAGLHFYNTTIPTNCANVVAETGTAELSCDYASTTSSDLTVRDGARLRVDIAKNVTFNGMVTVDGTLSKTSAAGVQYLCGTLAGKGGIEGGNIRFRGADTRWKMAADDTGFTSKVDVSGITDAAFLTELKAIDVTYTGTTTQALEIGPAFTWTIDTLDGIALTVTDGAGEPVPDCWLWIADGKLMLHLNDGGYVITAKWLGGAADDIADPANWLCSNKVGEVSGRVPMCATVVTLPDGCAFTCTNGAPFVCRQLNLPATLGGDSDFRGVTAPMNGNGTIDLQGHKVYFNRADCAVTIRDCEYLILEWLRAPKGAYINTGFTPTSESRVTMDLTVGGAGENWFGSAGAGSSWWKDRAFALSNDGGGIYVGHGSDSGTFGGKILPVGWRGTVELNQNVFTATPNGATVAERTISRTKQTFTSPNTLFLFANNQSQSTDLRFKAANNVTCYGCRIYANASDAEPVRDFVPAIRLSDGAVGMIDRANGDAWYGNAGSPAFVAGPVTAMPDVGEVHFDIPEGETVTNTGILMKGMLKMVKEGAGTLVAEKTGQIYSGGTEIVAGTLKAQNTGYPCRNTNDVVTVGANATLDVNQTTESNGASAACLYRLAGGTITNSGTTGSTWAGTSQSLGHMVLTDDSSIAMSFATNTVGFGFQNYRNGATTLEMNGHTLTVDTGAGIFFLYNCTVTGGGRIHVTQADRVDVAIGALAASGTELDSAAAVIPYDPGNHVIGDLTLRCPTVHGTTTTITSFKVVGAYKPVADAITGGIVMQDGSTFDLRERTTALDISSKKVTFADGATVAVDVRGRHGVGGKAVITWETDKAPANLTGLTFKAPAGAQYNVTKRADGVYIVAGLVITIR